MMLHQIAAQVSAQPADIRAEVLLARLLQDGLAAGDITIRQQGQAMRPVSPDVDAVRIENTSGHTPQMTWYLNRDSLYDTLPEGVFHQSAGTHKKLSAHEITAVYRRHKKEEQEARLFFAPLEQEFFLQKTFTEQHLQQQMERIQHAMLDNEVLELLGIDPSLPFPFTTALVRLLCYAPVIAGNIPLTEQVCSLLLGQPVHIQQRPNPVTLQHRLDKPLGNTRLGNGVILGKSSTALQYRYRMIIGPVSAERLLYFLGNNPGAQCIQTLIRFFIPVAWDMQVRVTAAAGRQGFVLDTANSSAGRLGYNIVLRTTNEVENG